MIRNLSAAFPYLWAFLLAESFAVSLFFQGIHDIRIVAIMLGVLVFGFFTAVLPGLRAGWRIPRSMTVRFVALFWAFLALSVFWSVIPYISIVFVYIIGVLPFLFFAILCAPDPRTQARICAFAIGVVLTGLALAALVQFFFLYETYGERVHGPLLSANNLAVMLAMAVLPALGFFLQAKGARAITLAAVLLAVFYMALLVTQSRGAFLSCGTAALVLVALAYKDTRQPLWRLPAALCGAALIFLLLDLSTGLTISNTVSQMSVPSENASAFTREALWLSTWQMIKDHFWLGTGLGTFFLHYPVYRQPFEFSDGFFAHSDPLQFWSEMGIAAPVIFYGLLIAVLLRTSKALSWLPRGTDRRMKISASFSALLTLLLHAHIDFHFYVLPILFPAGVVFAYRYAATESVLKDVRLEIAAPRWRRSIVIGSALVFLLAFSWIARAGAGIWFITEASDALGASDVARAERALDKADFWAPGAYSSVPEYKGRLSTLRLRNVDPSTPEDVLREIYRKGQENFAESNRLNPRSPYSINFEGLLHYHALRAGIAPDGGLRAEVLLQKALEIDPLFLTGRVGLAELYKERGEEAKALAVLEAGLPWPKPKTMQTVFYLMQTAELHRKLKGTEDGIYDRIFQEAKGLNAYIDVRL